MPEGYDGLRTGDESERTDDPNEYKRTCIDFIEDISHDYEAWVDSVSYTHLTLPTIYSV